MNFTLKEGDVLIIAGPSGSGKSTISYAMNGIIPWRQKGFLKGDVQIFNKSIWDYDFTEICRNVGLVKQNPLDQLTTFTVKDEISFGLENLNYTENEIKERVKNVSDFMEINYLLNRDIDQLSGGQKQLTILSSFLAMEPKILILDEPIAFLDQHSESLLLNRLKKLIKSDEFNLTLVIIEHRLSRVIDIADKIIVLDDNGKIALQGTVNEILFKKFEELKECNVRVPWIIDLYNEFKKIESNSQKSENPSSFQDLLEIISKMTQNELNNILKVLIDKEIKPKALKKYSEFEEKIDFEELYIETFKDKVPSFPANEKVISLDSVERGNIILETQNLSFKYPNSGIKAINDLTIKIQKGDFIGLVGPNGSGKTTLLYLLANLYVPSSGKILFNNQNLEEINPYFYAKKVGFIFQNPESMIFKSTIKDEILYAPRNFGILKEVSKEYFLKLKTLIGNESEFKNPFKLSWGQKRRLNLSSIFVYNPQIILLDEPFIGQDQKTIDSLIETLYIENKRGKTIIISSHDYHLLLKYTKRIIELNKDGSLRDYDINSNYFLKHKNLGPVILFERINERLESEFK
ncbi:MAG: ABC transporter ATP-binding protein [Candidatus Hodarchaeota archaeon]